MRSAFSCAGAIALALPLAAQMGSVSRSVSVSVTNVDVVVTDAAGKPITDLSPADFEVRQDGKRQPITNFSFVRNAPPSSSPADAAAAPPMPTLAAPSEPAPPPAARAHLIVFLDELHLTNVNRNLALRSLREYLPTVVGPNVEAQLVTWDRALHIRGPFVSDASAPALHALRARRRRPRSATFQSASARTSSGRSIRRSWPTRECRDPPQNIVNTIRAWADFQAADVDATGDAVRAHFLPCPASTGGKCSSS